MQAPEQPIFRLAVPRALKESQKTTGTSAGGASWSLLSVCRLHSLRSSSAPSAFIGRSSVVHPVRRAAFRDQVQRVGGLDPASQLLAPLAYLYNIELCCY